MTVNIFDFADTWNDAGETFNGIKLDVTDTASEAGSSLIDLQRGGASGFRVNKLMQLLVDLDVIEQRRSTNPQAFNLYNTYTDASNYERLAIKWSSNRIFIGSDGAGTGDDRRDLVIGNTVNFDNQANIVFTGSSTTAIVKYYTRSTHQFYEDGNRKFLISGSAIYSDASSSMALGLVGTGDPLGFEYLVLEEQSSDPANPNEGQSVLWQSDGTGTGADGDILMKITAGGVTKTATIVDFSAV